jgi:hypothetical protein
MQRMHTLDPTLCAIDVQSPIAQIDLSPTQLTQLLGSQAMTIRNRSITTLQLLLTNNATRALFVCYLFARVRSPLICRELEHSLEI